MAAEERQHAAGDPDQQGGAGLPARLPQHAAGHQEAARADHRADHDEDQVANAEDAVHHGSAEYLVVPGKGVDWTWFHVA
jgi:hypothetical protein